MAKNHVVDHLLDNGTLCMLNKQKPFKMVVCPMCKKQELHKYLKDSKILLRVREVCFQSDRIRLGKIGKN